MMRAALACGLMLLAGAALAQDAPAPPVSAEFVRLFSDYCLAKFPDPEALAKTAADDKLEPLTTAQLQNYLRSDPGQGWLIKGADGDYVLTEEKPPYHGCAVRRYGAALLGWVAGAMVVSDPWFEAHSPSGSTDAWELPVSLAAAVAVVLVGLLLRRRAVPAAPTP